MPHEPGHVFDPYNLSPEEEKARRLLRQAEDALAPAAMRGQLGERGPLQEFLIEQADEIKNITGAKRARITDPDAFGAFLAGRSDEFEEFTGRPSPMRQAMIEQSKTEPRGFLQEVPDQPGGFSDLALLAGLPVTVPYAFIKESAQEGVRAASLNMPKTELGFNPWTDFYFDPSTGFSSQMSGDLHPSTIKGAPESALVRSKELQAAGMSKFAADQRAFKESEDYPTGTKFLMEDVLSDPLLFAPIDIGLAKTAFSGTRAGISGLRGQTPLISRAIAEGTEAALRPIGQFAADVGQTGVGNVLQPTPPVRQAARAADDVTGGGARRTFRSHVNLPEPPPKIQELIDLGGGVRTEDFMLQPNNVPATSERLRSRVAQAELELGRDANYSDSAAAERFARKIDDKGIDFLEDFPNSTNDEIFDRIEDLLPRTINDAGEDVGINAANTPLPELSRILHARSRELRTNAQRQIDEVGNIEAQAIEAAVKRGEEATVAATRPATPDVTGGGLNARIRSREAERVARTADAEQDFIPFHGDQIVDRGPQDLNTGSGRLTASRQALDRGNSAGAAVLKAQEDVISNFTDRGDPRAVFLRGGMGKEFGDIYAREVARLDALDLPTDVAARARVIANEPGAVSADEFMRAINGQTELAPRPQRGPNPDVQSVIGEIPPSPATPDVPPVRAADEGSQFSDMRTGEPVTFRFIRNTEPAPNFGTRFAQDVEPSGRYMSELTGPATRQPVGYETGSVTFKNPLYVNFGEGYESPGNWKRILANQYDATGEELSRKLTQDGFDGIVTVQNGMPSEIVDLTRTPVPPPVRAADAPISATPYKDYFLARAEEIARSKEGRPAVAADVPPVRVGDETVEVTPLPFDETAEAARRAAVDAEIDALPTDGGLQRKYPRAERDANGQLVFNDYPDPSFGAQQGRLLTDAGSPSGPIIPGRTPLVSGFPPDPPRPGTPLLEGMEYPTLDPNNPFSLPSNPLPELSKIDTFRNQAIRMGQAIKLPKLRLRNRVGAFVDQTVKRVDRIIRSQAALFSENYGRAIVDAFPDMDDAGRIPSLAGIDSRVSGAPHWTDIGPRFPTYEPHLNEAQLLAYTNLRNALVPYRETLRQLRVTLDSRHDVQIGGGFYIPRTPDAEGMRAVLDINEPIILRDVTSPEAARGRESFEKAATFESAAAGIDEGNLKYLLPEEGLNAYIQDVGTRSTKAWIANLLVDTLDETGYPIARPIKEGAKRTVAVVNEQGKVVGSTRVRVSSVERGQVRLPKTNLADINDYDFPSELADAVNYALDNPQSYIGKLPVAKEIWAFNRLWRSFKSTLDNSGLGIQAWPLMASNPQLISAIFRINANALRNPKVFAAWMRATNAQFLKEGRVGIEEMSRRGLDLGRRTEFNFSNQGVEGAIARIPGVRRADSTFSQTGRGARITLFDALLEQEMMGFSILGKEILPFGRRSLEDIRAAGGLEEIANIVNNLTGTATRRFGGGYGDVLLFAARFLQSRIETLAKAASGVRPNAPLSHRIARRNVLKIIGLMTTLTWLLNESRDKDTDFRPIVNGRYNSNFVRVMDVGGKDISLFGPYDSLAALMVNVGIGVQGGNPGQIANAFRGLTGGAVGQVWDNFITKSDFLGRPITNNKERLEHFARSIMPFSGEEAAQNGAEAARAAADADIKNVVTSVGSGLVATTGIRASERSITDILNAAALEQYPQQTAAARGRFGTVAANPYDLLESYQKKDLRESLGTQLDPRITNRQDNQSRYYREIDIITDERLVRELDIVQQVAAGTMSKDVAKDNYGEAQSEAAIRRKQAAKDFGIEFEEQSLDESEGNKLALQQYYDLMEPGRPSGGTPVVNKAGNFMGWKVWDAEMVKLMNGWQRDGTINYVLRNIRDSEHADGMLARGAGQILSTATLDRIAASEAARAEAGGAPRTSRTGISTGTTIPTWRELADQGLVGPSWMREEALLRLEEANLAPTR